jgi:hypothetical protein
MFVLYLQRSLPQWEGSPDDVVFRCHSAVSIPISVIRRNDNRARLSEMSE